MDDAAMFEMLAKYAEGLNTTPIEVLRLFLHVGILFGTVVGGLAVFAFDCLLDRFFSGIGHLFRWFRSRKKEL